MGNEKLLDIKNLSVTYKTEDGIVYAVNDLNMEIGHKETLGFVGETGAGKTTTMKMLFIFSSLYPMNMG